MIRLAVRVARSHADAVLAELLELVPGGLEERDVDAGTVEFALYGASGELPDVGEVRAAAGGALVEVSTSELPDGWEERWRDWHRPLDVGPLRLRPPWAPARAGALDVVIDPGQAFGTGAHPSTRLTLKLLVELPREGALADWGCGSGILSVAAARLGFGPVLACDSDREAVAATLAAAAANGVPAIERAGAPGIGPDDLDRPRISVGRRDLGPDDPDRSRIVAGRHDVGPDDHDRSRIVVCRHDLRRSPGPWAPTVVANLVRPLLLEIAAGMERAPERLIASGLETGEVDEVAAAFARHGLAPRARRDGDGWSAILLGR
jgi:ribosomal protein L11 methyltransferase